MQVTTNIYFTLFLLSNHMFRAKPTMCLALNNLTFASSVAPSSDLTSSCGRCRSFTDTSQYPLFLFYFYVLIKLKICSYRSKCTKDVYTFVFNLLIIECP